MQITQNDKILSYVTVVANKQFVVYKSIIAFVVGCKAKVNPLLQRGHNSARMAKISLSK